MDERLPAQFRVLTDQYEEAKALPKKLETAGGYAKLARRRARTSASTRATCPATSAPSSLTPGQITQYAAHPRLDLFVDSNSPHPMEKFGCTICHAGQGSATDFELSDHTPADAASTRSGRTRYHWHADHDWEFPMLSSRFVESSCLKCHHEVTDLVREGSKEEAPKLLRGFNLVRENGCFGCHEIAGIKSGREVGPDLRLEPTPALDWLTPTEQDKAKADPTNPPGTYPQGRPQPAPHRREDQRGMGARAGSSRRAASGPTPRCRTSTTSATTRRRRGRDALPDDQKDFPAAEIHSIAHYLFAESGKEFTESAATRARGQGHLPRRHGGSS